MPDGEQEEEEEDQLQQEQILMQTHDETKNISTSIHRYRMPARRTPASPAPETRAAAS